MIAIRDELVSDIGAREALLDRAFGPARFAKTCERLREGRLPAKGLSLVAMADDGRLVGTVRLWHVAAESGHAALMLGPLAVDAAMQGNGLGSALMDAALARAAAQGHGAVLLVGDGPYYGRFGFSGAFTRGLALPGPVERERFLARELTPGALDGAAGLVRATGAIPLRAAPLEQDLRRAA